MQEFTIESAKAEIINAVKAYLLKNDEGRYIMKEVNRLPLLMMGPPGVGKTQIAREIAEELELGFVSYSLTHHTRSTLLGLPVIDEAKDGEEIVKYTHYTMSEIIEAVYARVNSGEKEGILLLDEFPCMADSITPIMLEFLQNKNIGRHRLPEGWVIVLCGNPPEYNRSARRFDAAVWDRVRLIDIKYSVKDFLAYAERRNIARVIIDYLRIYQQDSFFFNYQDGKQELVTCRGWENLSETIKAYGRIGATIGYEIVSEYIKSETIARRFAGFYKQFRDENDGLIDDIKDIIAGKFDKETVALFRKEGMRKCMNKMEYVSEYLLGDENAKIGKRDQKKIAEGFDNILCFSELVDPSGVIKEKLLQKYKETEKLLISMANFPQPLFMEYVKKLWRGRKYDKGKTDEVFA